jgi:hypothetical protein
MASEIMSTPRPLVTAQNSFFEKSRESRNSPCEPVEVYLLDMQGLRLPGILRDVARNGLRIELNMPLKAGDRLEVVRENHAIIFGEVRYCRRADDCYHAAVLIGDVLYPKAIPPAETGESTTNTGSARARSTPRRAASASPAGPPGTHISAREADGFFRGRLSDTKAALLDRHLATCKRCLDLMLLTLEKRLSTGAFYASTEDVCETQLH